MDSYGYSCGLSMIKLWKVMGIVMVLLKCLHGCGSETAGMCSRDYLKTIFALQTFDIGSANVLKTTIIEI